MPLPLPRLLLPSKLLLRRRRLSLMFLRRARLRRSTSLLLHPLTTGLRGRSTSRLRRLPDLLRRSISPRPLRLPKKPPLLLLGSLLLLPLLPLPHLLLLRLWPLNQPKTTESPPSGQHMNPSSSLRLRSLPVDGVKAGSTTMPMTRTRRMRSPRLEDSVLLGARSREDLRPSRRVRPLSEVLQERARGRS